MAACNASGAGLVSGAPPRGMGRLRIRSRPPSSSLPGTLPRAHLMRSTRALADGGEIPKSKIQAAEDAVRLALASRWQEALAVNDDLLERFGADEEISNRRGKALLELGRLAEAEAAYAATLAVNPGNQIARRQLAQLAERRPARGRVAPVSASVDVAVFTDEPGKTAITKLIVAHDVEPTAVAPGDPIEVEVGDEQVAVR